MTSNDNRPASPVDGELASSVLRLTEGEQWVLQLIRSAKRTGLTRSEVTRAVARLVEQAAMNLERQGRITRTTERVGDRGPEATVYRVDQECRSPETELSPRVLRLVQQSGEAGIRLSQLLKAVSPFTADALDRAILPLMASGQINTAKVRSGKRGPLTTVLFAQTPITDAAKAPNG